MTETSCPESIEDACKRGILERLADEYIIYCYSKEQKEENDKDEKRKTRGISIARFPNVAGFCRYYGIGQGRYERLSKRYPEEFEKLCAIFEDEALNAQISPSLLTAYLKRRLGYAQTSEDNSSDVDMGQLRVVFEHDILSDGE